MQRIARSLNTSTLARASDIGHAWAKPLSPEVKTTYMVNIPDRVGAKRLQYFKEHKKGLEEAIANGHIIAHGRTLKTCPSIAQQVSRRGKNRRLAASHTAEGNVKGSWFMLRAESIDALCERLAKDPMANEWELERIHVQPTEVDV